MPDAKETLSTQEVRMAIAPYPTDKEAREGILDVGRRMYERGFVAANDGNISVKVADDVLWATPTGVSKGFMTEDILVQVKTDGTVLYKKDRGPSSELKMHLRAYQENPLIRAVTHAHPPASTAFSIAGVSLGKPIYPEATVNLGIIPCVHYETPGTQGVPDSIAPYCRDYNGILLSNHGPVTWGKTLLEAFYRLESLENFALITLYLKQIGQEMLLSQRQVDDMIAVRSQLGTDSGGIPKGLDEPVNLQDHLIPQKGE